MIREQLFYERCGGIDKCVNFDATKLSLTDSKDLVINRMFDVAMFWLPIVGGILLGSIAVGAWYGGNKIHAIWFGFAGINCFLIIGVLQYQQVLSKNEAVVQRVKQIDSQPDIRRARLSIEFASPLSLQVTYFAPHAPGIRSFNINLPVNIKNYGQMPATITKVDAQLTVPNAGGFNSDPPLNPKSVTAKYTSESASSIWQGSYLGKIVAPSDKLTSFFPATFSYMNRPDILWHMEGLPKWLLVVVQYTDPLGTDGITSYYGEVSGSMSISAIANSTYNFWR